MNVLLGIGGDERSLAVLSSFARRVRETGDDLTVALVDRTDGEADHEAAVERVRRHLDEAGFEADVRVLSGPAGSRLVEVAEREGYDRLVIPGGEPSPMGKIAPDGMEEYVLLNCRTSVTILR